MTSFRRRPLLAKTLVCLLLSLGGAGACGPDFSPDIFVRPDRPDLPARYVQGKLGLLQPSFPRADLLLAYRYLDGGTLDTAEQKAWDPTFSQLWQQDYTAIAPPQPPTAIARWMLARSRFPDAPPGPIGQQRSIHTGVNGGSDYEVDYLNCADDAFATAALTLADRASRWGGTSTALHDWLQAQDAVFSNCSGGSSTPAPAPPGSPALLVEDRAYQRAAASFYSLALPAAREQFVAISKDAASPWQPLAGYLTGRTLVRQAFLATHAVAQQATYDPALMTEAAQQLRSYLAAAPSTALRQAAEAELALVSIRIEPEQRARELGTLLSGPTHDPRYAQDLKDLLWWIDAKTPDGLRAQPSYYLPQIPDKAHPGQMRSETLAEAAEAVAARRHEVYQATAPIRTLSPIIDWALTFASLDPAAAGHALSEWRRTHALAWLVAALALAPNDAAEDHALLAAAAAVPEDSPAWETVTYHRARLLLAAGHVDQARALIAAAMPKLPAEPSSLNSFRELAMRAAPTLAGFVEFAPRQVLLATSEEQSSNDECRNVMRNPRRHYHCVTEISPNQLDADAASILNAHAPLRVWLLAAQASTLGAQLRQAIAMSGWTRAVLLADSASARAFLPLLPGELRAQTGASPAPQPAPDQAPGPSAGFEYLLVLARNPGLSPYLNAGIQRSYSYDFVESYRDNWCYKPGETRGATPPAFLSSDESKTGVQQAQALAALHSADVGQRIVDYVQAHPDEPRAPEALYLVLRMIRYGCTEAATPPLPSAGNSYVALSVGVNSAESQQLLKVKQAAARLLRHRYVGSPWTGKAAPFAG